MGLKIAANNRRDGVLEIKLVWIKKRIRIKHNKHEKSFISHHLIFNLSPVYIKNINENKDKITPLSKHVR